MAHLPAVFPFVLAGHASIVYPLLSDPIFAMYPVTPFIDLSYSDPRITSISFCGKKFARN